jgi:uncharacterized repeat protein (TIGR03833 family)
MFEYVSDKGYRYRQTISGGVRRIPSQHNLSSGPTRVPCAGDKVKIIIKPYNQKIYIVGIVKRVLTKKKIHSRGHKVMLTCGTVGRMIGFT